MTPTKQELLQGLTYVQGMLTKIQEVLSRYIAQERNFRKKKSEINIKETILKDFKKIFTISAFALSALATLLFRDALGPTYLITLAFLFSVSFISKKIIMAGIKTFSTEAGFFTLMAIRRQTRKDIGLFALIAIIVYYISIFFFYIMVISTVLEGGILGITVFLAVIGIEVFFIVKKNQKIAAANQDIAVNNEQVRAKRKALYDQYSAFQQELRTHAPNWFPPDYYSVEAVDFFLHAIRNGRADSVKEMVNLFETTSQHKEMIAYQKEQTKRLNQLVNGQQKIQGQLRFANMMNLANFIKLDGIADTVGYY